MNAMVRGPFSTTMRSRPLLFTAAALLLAATVWLALRFGGAWRSADLAPPTVEESSAPSGPGQLRASAPPEPDAGPAEEERVVVPEDELAFAAANADEASDLEQPDPEAPLPPDPVELGDCALFLQVFERTTREPVATTIHLWRLDAPGNEHWTAGDQRQTILDIAEGGTWIRRLPEGRYRARCVAERRRNDDPEDFTVRCPTSTQHLDVDLPREREVLLRLYDAEGAPLRRAEVCLAQMGGSSHSVGSPSWVTSRRLREERDNWSFGVGGAWSGRGRRSWRALEADADGWFRVGSVLEGNRKTTPDYQLEARVEGLTQLSQRFDGDDESLRFVAVLVDPLPIERSVVTPDGRTSDELEDGLTVRSKAVAIEEDQDGRDTWRDAPLEAWRRWEKDYENFELEFRLSDLPLPTRALEPKDSSEN